MKKAVLILIIFLISSTSKLKAQEKLPNKVIFEKESLDWWQNSKFGMFVHWGLYSVAAGDWNEKPSRGNEHFMLYEKVPLKEYAQIANQFNPIKFNADEWVKKAKDAGMKYIVFTSKHHDGYAMYNSPSSNYNIVKTTGFARDPIKELAEACKKYGLKLGIYYSLGRDWEDPDVPTNWPTKGGRSNTWDYPNEDAKDFSKYFERKVKPQIKELLTQYGPISIMWFDTPENHITTQQSAELRQLIKDIQPGCIINNRIGNNLGDYNVFEQAISAKKDTKPWESCITMSGKWSYNRYDKAWKSPELMVRQLVEIVAKGGNLLLNLNPIGDGSFLPEANERLVEIGKWMEINQEAIYSTRPWEIATEQAMEPLTVETAEKTAKNTMQDTNNDNTSKEIKPDIYYTAKEKIVYLFARSWKSLEINSTSLLKGKYPVSNIVMLGSDQKINWKQDDNGIQISMPTKLPQIVPVYVFKVTLK